MNDVPVSDLPDHDTTPRTDEAHEFLITLLSTPPGHRTACPGWTAHELVAHLAAGAAEEADLIEAHLDGRPTRPTRQFDEREAPYRSLDDESLRNRLFDESLRLAAAVHRLGTGAVEFTGRMMTGADFAMHTRSECAVHRWDLVGRDDVGWAILGQPDLSRHAAAVLTSMDPLPESFVNRLDRSDLGSARLVIRSAPADDLVLEVDGGSVAATWAAPGSERADVECDPAQRLLLLWGRYEPSAPLQILDHGRPRTLLDRLLRVPAR